MADALGDALAAAVGRAHVLSDRDVVAGYEQDWTGRFSGPARHVVRPGSTQEVAAVLRACGEAGVAVVPQGGNTGLVGGGVPRGAGDRRRGRDARGAAAPRARRGPGLRGRLWGP